MDLGKLVLSESGDICFVGDSYDESFLFEKANGISRLVEIRHIAMTDTKGNILPIGALLEGYYNSTGAFFRDKTPILISNDRNKLLSSYNIIRNNRLNEWRSQNGQSNEIVDLFLNEYIRNAYSVGSNLVDQKSDPSIFYSPSMKHNQVNYTTDGQNVHYVRFNRIGEAESFYNIVNQELIEHYIDKMLNVTTFKPKQEGVMLDAKVIDESGEPVQLVIFNDGTFHTNNCIPDSLRLQHLHGKDPLDITKTFLKIVPNTTYGLGYDISKQLERAA
jgi:hypothetical protein